MLDGIRVLDFTRHLPGPYATDLLVRLGAEVTKIEPPQGDPARWLPPFDGDFGTLYTLLNRGKRSVVVDLSEDDGVSFVHRLANVCDVAIDSWRPGMAEKFSVDPASLQSINPRLICCSISGYGRNNPRSGHDANFVALSGLLDLQRDTEGRVVLPAAQLGDMGGALYASLLIVASLVEREKSGRGRILDVSMLAAARSLMPAAEALHHSSPEPDRTFFLTGSFPGYDVYRTKDSRELMVAPLETHFWERFCRAIGREELIPIQYDETRHEEVRSSVAETIARRTLAEWEEVFGAVDACVEPVLTLQEAEDRFGTYDETHPLTTNLGGLEAALEAPGKSLDAIGEEMGLDERERKSVRTSRTFHPRKDLKQRLERAVLRFNLKKR
ncbi:MAG: CoA transferase [Acidobacteria bacterium]|nr:CoA transferase [Acidobacteriota bacterium]